MEKGKWQLLPSCSKEAEGLDIILACDGSAANRQVEDEVTVKLTKINNWQTGCISALKCGYEQVIRHSFVKKEEDI